MAGNALSPERWRKVDEIFNGALDLAGDARSAYLNQSCGGDAALREEVEALLADDAIGGDRFEAPAAVGMTSLPTLPLIIRTHSEGDSLTGQRLGQFVLEEEIGRGGMGSVYRAIRDDDTFSQQVAIKILKHGWASRESVERFRRERQILALVNHPNIARILDGGSTPDGRPYLVMDLVDGETLIKACASRNLGLQARLALFLDICGAVAHAHQNLIIHRDLKPANIMVDTAGQVKLLDFGIAKMFHPDLPDHGHTRNASEVFITPEYASPEQVRIEPITTATDVYALGLVLFELLTGQKAQPVTGATRLEVERAICDTEPRKPSDMPLEGVLHTANKLRGDLDNIVLKALRKDPRRRYSTVNQFADDVQRFLDGKTVTARADSIVYRGRKFLSRNKWAVAALALILASLIGGAAAAKYQAIIARRHFESVRGLATSLLTEINPALNNVPGATKARHLIAQRSLEYLDKVGQSAGDNVELLTELAAGYETIGNLQGNRNKENLGDYEGAMKSFRKSLALYQTIEKLRPSPKNRTWMVLIRAEAARIYPNTDDALRLAEEALTGALALDREEPGKYLVPVANAYFGLGYVHDQREEVLEAIEAFTKSREVGVAAKRSKNNLAVCDRYIGTLYRKSQDPEKAEFHGRRALVLDEERVREEPSPRAKMDLSYDYESLARTLRMQGQLAAALEMATKCEKLRDELAKADAHDNRPRMAKADIDEVMGQIQASLGHKSDMLLYFARAIDVRESLVRASPESPEDEYELGRAYAAASGSYAAFHLCSQANDWSGRARQIFEKQHRRLSLSNLDRQPACK